MAKSKCRWEPPEDWSEWSDYLAAGLHARNRWRLPVLFLGILFAQGRRTVTTWLRAAGVSNDFQDNTVRHAVCLAGLRLSYWGRWVAYGKIDDYFPGNL